MLWLGILIYASSPERAVKVATLAIAVDKPQRQHRQAFR